MRKSVKRKLTLVRQQLKEYMTFAASDGMELALQPGADEAAAAEAAAAFEERRAALRAACADLIAAVDYNGELTARRGAIQARMEDKLGRALCRVRMLRGKSQEPDAYSIERAVGKLTGGGDALSEDRAAQLLLGGNPAFNYIVKYLSYSISPEAGRATQLLKAVSSGSGIDTRAMLQDHIKDPEGKLAPCIKGAAAAYTRERIVACMLSNEKLSASARDYQRMAERGSMVKAGLLDAIPATYPELFPLARQMKRHFVLHIGPTNSGKSYQAIEALKTAESGIYLAPLRLLAFEKFEELNEAGCACTLKTGEEEIGIPFSYLQSSTIEVLDFSQKYEVAVIDEAQMVADRQRGSAWTFAILGIQAEKVHICLAPEAEKVIISLIEACGDSYVIVRHKRLVPLTFEYDSPIHFPDRAQRGTAFIVFSRRDVHAAAAELQRHGYSCSVIYGALPYDVRRNEVKRYLRGETDLVVATDAIGMGLNLPIERVYFLASEKFNGIERRPLTPTEIKQIGGRAGRFGLFDHGYVGADIDRRLFATAIGATVPQIKQARIGFPYSLIGIDGPVSQLMTKWCEIEAKPGFEVADLSREIELAQELERLTDDKELVYSFVMIPFDEKTPELKALWQQLFEEETSAQGGDYMSYLPPSPGEGFHLDELELMFKECDLIYHYAEKFVEGSSEDLRYILMRKNEISAVIMDKLASEELHTKTCRVCGRPLPFSYKFGICDRCFRRQRGRR